MNLRGGGGDKGKVKRARRKREGRKGRWEQEGGTRDDKARAREE